MLVINEKIAIRIAEFDFSFARSPGPGGQNVNKVNSKAVLKWSVADNRSLPDPVKARFQKRYSRRINKEGFLILTSHRYRDQGRNIADCLSKLRELILEVLPEPVIRKKKKVSAGAKRRRVESKRRNSDKKQSRRSPRDDD